MNIRQELALPKRQTAADELFKLLRDEIISLKIAPGTKLSEVEIAKRHGVSRQPVREAFMRLGEMNLLLIRPQKATLVRKISLKTLYDARFIRTAVELEVVRMACKNKTEESIADLEIQLEKQKKAMDNNDPLLFQELDYEFHYCICKAGDCVSIFDTISEQKAHTNRVCTLELADKISMQEVYDGHKGMVDAISDADEVLAVKRTRYHLTHLDATLSKAIENYPNFFEA